MRLLGLVAEFFDEFVDDFGYTSHKRFVFKSFEGVSKSPCAMVPVDLDNHHGVVQEKTVRCASSKYSTPWRQAIYKYDLKWIKVR